MSRDKQIEGMAKDIASTPIGTVKPDLTLTEMGEVYEGTFILRIAKHLYQEDYRKIYDDNQRQCTCYALGCQMAEQLEKKVAKEIFAEIESKKIFLKDRAGNIGIVVRLKDIAELKKKYTEEGK